MTLRNCIIQPELDRIRVDFVFIRHDKKDSNPWTLEKTLNLNISMQRAVSLCFFCACLFCFVLRPLPNEIAHLKGPYHLNQFFDI